MTSTPTIRFANDQERRSYEVGMKLVTQKLAAGKTQAQHRLTAARLGVAPDVVSSVILCAAAEALTGIKRLAAQRKTAKLATPAPAPARRAPAKSASTVHRFEVRRICTNTSLFG